MDQKRFSKNGKAVANHLADPVGLLSSSLYDNRVGCLCGPVGLAGRMAWLNRRLLDIECSGVTKNIWRNTRVS